MSSIDVRVPDVSTIIQRGVEVELAYQGTTWSEIPLGDDRKKVGVYVIHHNEEIVYVGKTDGSKMSFGTRLRRHLQEKAAGKHTFPRLSTLRVPPSIRVSLFPLEEIQKHIDHDVEGPNVKHMIPLFESALILALKPRFQGDGAAGA